MPKAILRSKNPVLPWPTAPGVETPAEQTSIAALQACLDWNVRRSGKSGGIPDGLPPPSPAGQNKIFPAECGPGDLVEIGRVIGYNKNIQLKFMEAST